MEKGRSRGDLDKKQQEALFKRIENTPADIKEGSEVVSKILESILGHVEKVSLPHSKLDLSFESSFCSDQTEEDFVDFITTNARDRETAIQNSPVFKGTTHKPPTKQKVTPVKGPYLEDSAQDMPNVKIKRIKMKTHKNNLMSTIEQRRKT